MPLGLYLYIESVSNVLPSVDFESGSAKVSMFTGLRTYKVDYLLYMICVIGMLNIVE